MNLLDLMVKIGVDDQASGQVEVIASKITGGLGRAVAGVAKIGAAAAVAAGAGAVAIGKGAIDAYASYEQLVGGVDKLYGDASERLQQYAQNAYATSGLSANQYMEQATSFSAALINSLGGDTAKAAEMTDLAMRAMADNVDTFGSDMESVQNAFQGFSKANYTMLDNLRLGFAGTKEGAEQLVAAAASMTEEQERLGVTVDANSLSFDNLVAAIAVVQENMGIAGTTANEAMTTIEGSARMARTSWENLLTAIGAGDAEMIGSAVSGLVDGIFGKFSEETQRREGGLINNLIPVVRNVGSALIAEIPSIAKTMALSFVSVVAEVLGKGDISGWLEERSVEFDSFMQGLMQAARDFMGGFLSTFRTAEFESALGRIKSIAGQVFGFLEDNADEIGAALGVVADVIGAVANAFMTVLDVLGPFVPSILAVIGAFAGFNALAPVIGAVTGAITTFTTVILPALTAVQSLGGAVALVTTLLGGPIPIIAAVVAAIVGFIATNEDAREAIVSAWNAVKTSVSKALSDLSKWMATKWDEIKRKVTETWNAVKTAIGTAWSGIKETVSGAVAAVLGSVTAAFTAIAGAVTGAMSSVKSAISGAFESANGAVSDAVASMGSAVTRGFDGIVSFVSGIPRRILSALGNLGSLLWDAGSGLMGGLLSGITSGFSSVASYVSGIASKIARLKGPLPYDKTVLVPNGLALMQSLRKGLEGGFESKVKPYVSTLASDVSNSISGTMTVEGASKSAGPTLYLTIENMTVRNRDDADYMARRINQLWKYETEGTLR